MAINRFSEIACFELIEYYLTVVTKWRSALTYISPESVEYSFFQAHSFQFVYAASRGIPLSPLSPRCPFCPGEPWIPGSPFAPFFPSAPRGPWVPVFPGLPRSPLAPSRPGAPGAPGMHVMYVHIPVCPPLLHVGQDWTCCKKEKKSMTNCVSIQARKYFLIIFQVLIVFFFFFSENVNYDFLKKKIIFQ